MVDEEGADEAGWRTKTAPDEDSSTRRSQHPDEGGRLSADHGMPFRDRRVIKILALTFRIDRLTLFVMGKNWDDEDSRLERSRRDAEEQAQRQREQAERDRERSEREHAEREDKKSGGWW